MNIDTDALKKRLEEEERSLEEGLAGIARKKPGNPLDWETTPPPPDPVQADKNDMADRLEDFGERHSTEIQLELRLASIRKALDRMKNGTYGRCEVDGEPIDAERLLANPAATTCIKHAE